MKDTYRHKGLRRKLIASIRKKGISNERILKVMESLPRHFFLEKAFEEWAYEDKAFPIGNEQTISQPYTVAFQTDLLALKKRDKVLEIGTGSGYQAAVLALLGARVYSIERQELLHFRAKNILESLRINNIRLYMKDGFKGLPEFRPFDKILVTCGATEIPESLTKQLGIGGIMVIPVGSRDIQEMIRITRVSDKDYKMEKFGEFRFVPFLKGVNKNN